MKKFIKFYYKLQTILIVTLFTLVVAVTFFQVVNRTLIKMTVTWPEELARYLIVWMIFVASVAAFRRGAMIGVDVITGRLRGITKLVFDVFQNVVVVAFAAVVAYYCFIIIAMQLEVGQLSPALHLTMAVPYTAIPVWGILTVIEVTISTIQKIRNYINKSPAQA